MGVKYLRGEPDVKDKRFKKEKDRLTKAKTIAELKSILLDILEKV